MNINRVKGQISIFIIIGVILIFGVIFLISTSFDEVPIFSDEKSSYNVKEFVESCLLLETKTAVEKLGNSGGWLYPKPMMYTDRQNIKEMNRIATGLDYLEKNKMPYWYYYDDSDELFKTYIPEYDSDSEFSMKNQIKRYIDENIESNCFRNFDNFKDIYNVKYDISQIDSNVRLLEKEIVVDLSLDLEVEDIVDSNTDKISSFKIKSENKLYLPYHLAIEIVKAEINSSFVDERIMHILRPYQSSEGRELLPPQSETKMEYDFDIWRMEDVEKTAKQILSSEISRIQFLNTNYQNREIPESLKGNEFVQATNSLFTKDYLSENTNLDEDNSKLFNKFQDLKVTPTFEPFFPIFFRIKQAIGDIILLPQPEMFGGFLPIFYTHYKASYEIVAPIVFEIKSSEVNDDFIFNLPIEANVKHNSALKNNYKLKVTQDSKSSIEKPKKTLICDQSQFVSDVVSIDLVDNIYFGERERSSPKKGVDDAIIQFTCKNLVQCYVGKTAFGGNENISEDIRDTTTKLRFRLPVDCEPGKLEINKFGHEKVVFEGLNPKVNEPIELGEVEMNSGKDIKVKVNLKRPGTSSFGGKRVLQEHDSGFLIFENIDDKNIIRVINVDSENQYNQSINLIPGRYKITGLVIYDNQIDIPQEKVCYKTGLFGGKDCETIPATNLKSWLKGGYEMPEFVVNPTKLINSDVLEVSFVEYDLPEDYDSLKVASEQMAELGSFSIPPRLTNE